ncbi:MAG: NDP-hexose 4-ketoreductase, partial [Actinomycetota bacterium]|nr:NDP-hexose 4-ketoreductase [Actinomycetota bacterium]
MFERFTTGARRVVVLAQEEARRAGYPYIGTEHLLLGMLAAEGTPAHRTLLDLGVTLERARAAVEEAVPAGKGAPAPHIPFNPRAKKVLELALREALRLHHREIGSSHVGLGLIREGGGMAVKLLTGPLGVDLDLWK